MTFCDETLYAIISISSSPNTLKEGPAVRAFSSLDGAYLGDSASLLAEPPIFLGGSHSSYD